MGLRSLGSGTVVVLSVLFVGCAPDLSEPMQQQLQKQLDEQAAEHMAKVKKQCEDTGGQMVLEYHEWSKEWSPRYCVPPNFNPKILESLDKQ